MKLLLKLPISIKQFWLISLAIILCNILTIKTHLKLTLKKIILFTVIVIMPYQVLAGGFDLMVKELVAEKLGNDLSFETMFESKSKLEKLRANEDLIKSVSLSYFSPETRSFKVVAVLDKDEKIEIFGKFEAFFEVPVTTRTVRYGESLSSTDIKSVKVKKLKAGQAPVKDLSKLIGMQAKYNIPVGSIIKISELKNPPVIKENDPVTLLYSSRDITLKTVGVALAPGAVGEKIRVKNEKTGIIVFGEIVDKNTVRVSDANGK